MLYICYIYICHIYIICYMYVMCERKRLFSFLHTPPGSRAWFKNWQAFCPPYFWGFLFCIFLHYVLKIMHYVMSHYVCICIFCWKFQVFDVQHPRPSDSERRLLPPLKYLKQKACQGWSKQPLQCAWHWPAPKQGHGVVSSDRAFDWWVRLRLWQNQFGPMALSWTSGAFKEFHQPTGRYTN